MQTAVARALFAEQKACLLGSEGWSWATIRALLRASSRGVRVAMLCTNQGLLHSGLPRRRVCSALMMAD
eukprot:11076194-Ditylum_brightwellii.AAC.1